MVTYSHPYNRSMGSNVVFWYTDIHKSKAFSPKHNKTEKQAQSVFKFQTKARNSLKILDPCIHVHVSMWASDVCAVPQYECRGQRTAPVNMCFLESERRLAGLAVSGFIH